MNSHRQNDTVSPPAARAGLSRRSFLRSAGIALALPWLETLRSAARGAATEPPPPRRMLAICAPLGIYTPDLYPSTAGRDYRLTPYLEVLQELREQFTIISGLSHPGVDGGHSAERSYLTAAPHPGGSTFRNTISLDQFAAEQIGRQTRFASLTLCAEEGFGLAWSRDGVRIPADCSPSRLFTRLFLEGTAEDKTRHFRRLREGQSIMDLVHDQARRMQRRVSVRDRQTLDQYFTSVRELESTLHKNEQWTEKSKPRVEAEPPEEVANPADFVARTRMMYDVIHLALQTDSTRLITLMGAGGNAAPPIEGVDEGWHNLSHHGKDPSKLEQLRLVELEEMRALRDLLQKLQQSPEGGETLLDRTTVLFGSNLGDASSHSNRNTPVLLAGGPFRHGRHLAFDPDDHPPLCDLFVSILQGLGLEVDRFASGSGTLSGLEFVRGEE